jgi:hypothetical protein
VRHSRVAMVVASALVLASCGSAGGSSDSVTKSTVPVSRKIVLTSITTTAAAKTARIDLQMKMTGGSKGSFDVTGEGVADFGSGDSDVTMQFDGPIGTVTGDGFEIRSVDGTVYMRVPSTLHAPLTEDKPWIAVDAPSGSNAFSSPFALGSQSDPTKALAYLEKVSSDVREVGSESIRGVDTTHYTATVDLGKALEQNKDVPSGLRDSVKELAGLFGNIPADVWIDGDGRLRRLSLQLDLSEMFRGFGPSGSTGADHVVITETLDLYDFGTPVNVEAPPADQVTRMPSLGDLGTGGGDSSQGA